MPEISLFYGIRITMYWNTHNSPHFHAEYANNKAIILIEDGIVAEGQLPKRQLKFVLAWDIARNRNEYECIDIDPMTIFDCPIVPEI